MFKYILTFVPRDCALSENIPQQASYNLKKLCHSVNKRTYLSHRNTHLFLSDNLYLSKAVLTQELLHCSLFRLQGWRVRKCEGIFFLDPRGMLKQINHLGLFRVLTY